MPEPKDRFAENLRRLRHARGLTQEQLGDRCGMDLSAISRLERAKKDPQLSTLAKLAAGLDVSFDTLLDGVRPAG